MQSSLILYPQADRFIRVHESILHACKGDRSAAALVSFFEYWHNYRTQQIEYTAVMNDMLLAGQQPPILDTTGWQYHTDEQLERGIMIAKVDTIRKSINLLEFDLGFISTDVPERLKLLHKTGRTKWFLLMVNRINEWLADYARERGRVLLPKPVPTRAGRSEKVMDNPDVRAVFNYRNRRRIEYWQEHGRKVASPAPSGKVFRLIETRLKEGSSVIDLCMAVEGNLSSEWHQGKNDREKVYDGFDLIFRDAEKVEAFATRAYEAGITPASIQKALDLNSKPDAERSEPVKDATLISKTVALALVPHVVSMPSDPVGAIFDLIEATGAETDETLPEFDLILPTVKEQVEAEVGMFTGDHSTNLITLYNTLMEKL